MLNQFGSRTCLRRNALPLRVAANASACALPISYGVPRHCTKLTRSVLAADGIAVPQVTERVDHCLYRHDRAAASRSGVGTRLPPQLPTECLLRVKTGSAYADSTPDSRRPYTDRSGGPR